MTAVDAPLLRRRVVKWLAFVDYVHRQKLERLVAHHFECAVRRVATIDNSRAGGERHLLPVRSFECAALDDVGCLFAVMDVKSTGLPWLYFDKACNDLHVST